MLSASQLSVRTSNTGRFVMFPVITNIHNKKTKGSTWMELFTATGKLKKFFWQLEMFDVFLPHTHTHTHVNFVDTCVARTWLSYRCVPCHLWCTHWTSLFVKKNIFSFPVAV